VVERSSEGRYTEEKAERVEICTGGVIMEDRGECKRLCCKIMHPGE
jgi:hypothetical protein